MKQDDRIKTIDNEDTKRKVGAPKGNNNAGTGRQATRALELALDSFENGDEEPQVIARMKTLMRMWKPVIQAALIDGDLAALKEIHDRLDGKAAQSIDLKATIEPIHFNLDYTSSDAD